MTLPLSTEEYQTAVQNPGVFFRDDELKQGLPHCDQNGVPKPSIGALAVVFRLNCPGRSVAVKFFTGVEVEEIRKKVRRCRIVADYLEKHCVSSHFVTGFECQEQGVLCKREWRPLLKMEWVDGELLNVYIENNLKQPKKILALADQWVCLAEELRIRKIAHGDLQHGNIIIEKGSEQIRLIDFDGAFVPGLEGQSPHEMGQPNYTHPGRKSQFDDRIDRFSQWVVFFSLWVAYREPQLWTSLGCGDGWLIFSKEDYEYPGQSRSLRLLSTSQRSDLRYVGTQMRKLIAMPATDLPALDQAALNTLFEEARGRKRNVRSHGDPAKQVSFGWAAVEGGYFGFLAFLTAVGMVARFAGFEVLALFFFLVLSVVIPVSLRIDFVNMREGLEPSWGRVIFQEKMDWIPRRVRARGNLAYFATTAALFCCVFLNGWISLLVAGSAVIGLTFASLMKFQS